MNKKGLFFSIMALVLVLFFIASIKPGPELVFKSSKELTIVSNLNDFVIDMESNYLSGLLKSNFMRSLKAGLLEINDSGKSIDDVILIDLMLFGESDEVDDDIEDLLELEDYTLIGYFDVLKNQIDEVYTVDSDFAIYDIEITEESLWHITLRMNITYNITSSVANWERDTIIYSNVSIMGLPDPLYVREENEFIPVNNLIYPDKNWTTDFIAFNDNWSIEDIETVRDENLFVPDRGGPSYLMRLQGYYDPSPCCGYHSIVESPSETNSNIDHKYYGSHYDEDELFEIRGTSPKIILDYNMLREYNLCRGYTSYSSQNLVYSLDTSTGFYELYWREGCTRYNP